MLPYMVNTWVCLQSALPNGLEVHIDSTELFKPLYISFNHNTARKA